MYLLPAVWAGSRPLQAVAACRIVEFHYALVAVELPTAEKLHHVPRLRRPKADPTSCQGCKPQEVVPLDAVEHATCNAIIAMCSWPVASLA